jgi:hypothetical protein
MTWHAKAMQSLDEGWCNYVEGLQKSLANLEKDVDEAASMSNSCTKEWCEAVEHVIDELANAIYSIHEPTFISKEQSKLLKDLRRKVHDLYYKYKVVTS